MKRSILNTIDSPEKVKELSYEDLDQLSAEIRREFIDRIPLNGGHLASNLGVVELTIALHRVFDSPMDKIIWDVGHQSYTHKLLTGRREKFASIRQYEGCQASPTAMRAPTMRSDVVTPARPCPPLWA